MSGEQVEHFSWVGMAPGLTLAVEHLAVDRYVEDAFTAHDKLEVGDDVLVVGEQVLGRAHGARRIISRHAVGDFDVVAHGHDAIAANVAPRASTKACGDTPISRPRRPPLQCIRSSAVAHSSTNTAPGRFCPNALMPPTT